MLVTKETAVGDPLGSQSHSVPPNSSGKIYQRH